MRSTKSDDILTINAGVTHPHQGTHPPLISFCRILGSSPNTQTQGYPEAGTHKCIRMWHEVFEPLQPTLYTPMAMNRLFPSPDEMLEIRC
jgi:hypothetical protein